MFENSRSVVPETLPRSFLERTDVAIACSTHDFGTLFDLIRRYGRLSQNRIAAAIDLGPSRVGEIIQGRRRITSMDVIVRISDRFSIPGRMLGLATRPWERIATDDAAMSALVALGDRRYVSTQETARFSELLGNIVDLEREVGIHIDKSGSAQLSFRYEVLNLTSRPLARLPRDLWFQHVNGQLNIYPIESQTDHRVAIQRVHDTPNLATKGTAF